MEKKYGIKYIDKIGRLEIAEFDSLYEKKQYIEEYQMEIMSIISEWGE